MTIAEMLTETLKLAQLVPKHSPHPDHNCVLDELALVLLVRVPTDVLLLEAQRRVSESRRDVNLDDE